uniref:Interleukin 17-1 n=1 Tax=Ciona intestinalis TaxID=7719 RepID=Q6L5M6_CIOIN|nr:interleukin 17-1 precursor [Ciona intestinalis]BAD22760.1 Interleukin 17-1 [Ciona intestinalis]|eukprot:NP_001123347.1 interleukin 17-1 precursor [Ciona intestinalis]
MTTTMQILIVLCAVAAINATPVLIKRFIEDLKCSSSVANKEICDLLKKQSAGNVTENQHGIRHKRSQSTCPVLSDEYLLTHTRQEERSLSPYVIEDDIDRLRIPMVLPRARCLCDGCIDMSSRRENFSFASVPLKQSFTVRKRNTENGPLETVTQTITVGCTCVVPRRISQ